MIFYPLNDLDNRSNDFIPEQPWKGDFILEKSFQPFSQMHSSRTIEEQMKEIFNTILTQKTHKS